MIHITHHAIERYRERVADLPEAQIRQCLSTPAIVLAATFGAHVVRLGSGHRVLIDGSSIITVLPAEHRERPFRFRRREEV